MWLDHLLDIMNRTRQGVAISNQALDIEVLKEILGSLRITEENISEESNRATKIISSNEDMFRAYILAIPAKIVLEITISKSIVPDLGWFNKGQKKFEDW